MISSSRGDKITAFGDFNVNHKTSHLEPQTKLSRDSYGLTSLIGLNERRNVLSRVEKAVVGGEVISI